jgi:hypothetical protein
MHHGEAWPETSAEQLAGRAVDKPARGGTLAHLNHFQKMIPGVAPAARSGVSDIGLATKLIHEACKVRDADKAQPGIARKVIEEMLQPSGHSLGKAQSRYGFRPSSDATGPHPCVHTWCSAPIGGAGRSMRQVPT